MRRTYHDAGGVNRKMRPVPQCAIDFVAQHEACRLRAYLDSASTWTIGYGHTLGVTQSSACSSVQAAAWLEEDLGIAAKRLAGVVDEAVILKLTDHQYAALLSFVFNCGAPPKATLWAELNAGKLDQVPAQLQRWIYAAGKIVPGLVNRRAAEVELWKTPDQEWPAPVPNPSSAVTRDAVQPVQHAGLIAKLRNLFA